MAARYSIHLYSPFTNARLTYTGTGTPTSPIALTGGSYVNVTLNTTNSLTLIQVLPTTLAGTNMVNVELTAKTPAGVIIRTWRASATSGVISISQATSQIITIEIRYVQPPEPTGALFDITAGFNCSGFTATDASGVAHTVSSHGTSTTFRSSGDVVISNIICQSTGAGVGNGYARASDYVNTKGTWNLQTDPYITYLGDDKPRYVMIRVWHNVPMFAWTTRDELQIVPGKPISNITAGKWNELENLVKELVFWSNSIYDSYVPNTVASGDQITSALVNNILLYGYAKLSVAWNSLSFQSVGREQIKASHFNGSGSLKNAINLQIQYINALDPPI